MLKNSFGKGEKIESIEFKQTPGYYMRTSLSGHFPSEHPLAYAPNLSKLKIDPAVKRMLKENKKHVPRLSAKEFNENFFCEGRAGACEAGGDLVVATVGGAI
ncbi:hypothetical protein TL16_g04141 [Triparma laevis f. inornata]|uniref:Uncharacterized protein n=1 Tax=Triparma laevis f. inornata TaxID=1714386 RepID=A0A9W7A3J6_9STRA|nr:hypothetical protein TL16_g04141 [Triparma laevis f. inornata]